MFFGSRDSDSFFLCAIVIHLVEAKAFFVPKPSGVVSGSQAEHIAFRVKDHLIGLVHGDAGDDESDQNAYHN